MRIVISLGLAVLAAAIQPSFEVASIKPAEAGEISSINWSGTQLTIKAYSPRMLIAWAYDVSDDRLTGESKWLDSAHYDIVAKPAEAPAFGQLQLMTQSLLAGRFRLVTHYETKQLPFYALVADKKGAKVKLSDPGTGRGQNEFKMSAAGHFTGSKVSADMLARVLSSQTGRSVQDFTQLKGIFDFTLVWSPDSDLQAAGSPGLPSIFTALQEQLGLKLESRNGPVDVLVVDSIERAPSEN